MVLHRPLGTSLLSMVGTLALAVAAISVPVFAQSPSGTFRLATFTVSGDMRLGATTGNGENDILDIHNGIRWLIQNNAPEAQNLPYIPADMKSLVEVGPKATAAIRQVYQALASRKANGAFKEPGGSNRVFHPSTAVKFLSPITNPSKIYGFAGNYPREGDLANPQFPSSFFKSVASIAGHEDVIDFNGLMTRGVHEPELSLIISKRGKNIPASQAMSYIYGYMICNDVSARDLPQGKHTMQGGTFDKGLDTFSPCGPFLTLAEDVKDPQGLAIEARVNGKPAPMPNSNTRYMTFKIPQIIEYISGRMTLEPGDVFQTGVPAPVVPMAIGDTIEITIEGLGTLRNHVVGDAKNSK
jgi:2-keto-4-pentenoate hydratase/2-oxohepta-3-ene-1,7-dioic acid hydratase in catechol pathway